VALIKNRVAYGEFSAFNHIGEIVTKGLGGM